MILNDVIAALSALFDAAVTVPVFDVPDPSIINNARFIAVGSDGVDVEGASADFEASDLGPGSWSDESGEVTCSAWAQSGGTDIENSRTAAGDLAEACVAAVNADRTLGGLLVGAGVARVSAVRYGALQLSTGNFSRFTFVVTYQHLNA